MNKTALILGTMALLGATAAEAQVCEQDQLQESLHYLRQRVEAEVFLSPDAVLDSAQVVGMRQRLAAQLPDDPYFRKIALICTIAPN